jgi:ATP-dependent RNA helicase SUPV3L1/SUV3
MKLDLDLKSGSLKNDIKSLRKAARQAIEPELMRRANKIMKGDNLKISMDHKIYWMDNPIGYIVPGKDYLNPKLKIIVDEAIDIESKENLIKYLEKWLHNHIKTELSDLVNLSNSKFQNNYERALCFQLFEKELYHTCSAESPVKLCI